MILIIHSSMRILINPLIILTFSCSAHLGVVRARRRVARLRARFLFWGGVRVGAWGSHLALMKMTPRFSHLSHARKVDNRSTI